MEQGDHVALFYYVDKDGNHAIDAGELTLVNVFANGGVHGTDVQLVGVGAGGNGIPGSEP